MNPLLVRRVRHLAELRPALRGLWSSGAAALLAQRRLYLADYSALEALRPRPGSVLYAPQVLLAASLTGELELLAILLHTRLPGVASHLLISPSAARPDVALPGRWLYAKMLVAAADAQMHEFGHHLPLHFLLEAVALAAHNSFGQGEDQHPLGALLAPHLSGTILINWVGRHTLLKEHDSIVEQAFSVGLSGALALSSSYNFSQLDLPATLAERGLDQVSGATLKYLFRDDGLRLWSILHTYLEGVVGRMYPTDHMVRRDAVVQVPLPSLTPSLGLGRRRG